MLCVSRRGSHFFGVFIAVNSMSGLCLSQQKLQGRGIWAVGCRECLNESMPRGLKSRRVWMSVVSKKRTSSSPDAAESPKNILRLQLIAASHPMMCAGKLHRALRRQLLRHAPSGSELPADDCPGRRLWLNENGVVLSELTNKRMNHKEGPSSILRSQ